MVLMRRKVPTETPVGDAPGAVDKEQCEHSQRPIVHRRDYWMRGTKMTVYASVCPDCGAVIAKSHRLGC